ncbi:MAG: SDR family NAD(P)-dependent oxidoreductase [Propionibacteriales bacterium]|nr:SDR family NAD(P)-dependent oxidoreductase [Propionibacteriales bacterium]
MKAYQGKVAVVTGAAAGMGQSMAVLLARYGAEVAICDVHPERLQDTAMSCREAGAEPLVAVVDVSELGAMSDFAADVVARFGRVDYVFNNAGIAFSGTFEQSEIKDLERVMNIDYWGVVNGTRAFLPHLIASTDGHVVNTSSVFGLFGVPSQGAYSAAKFAVRGFTESLRQEMLLTHPSLKVSCVHPGGIRTDIARNATSAGDELEERLINLFDKIAVTSADRAARVILRGAARGRAKILVGPDAVLMDAAVRFLGSSYQRPLAWTIGRLVPTWFSTDGPEPGSRG